MRLILYLLIAKGVLFAVTMMLPDKDEGRVFGAASPPSAISQPDSVPDRA